MSVMSKILEARKTKEKDYKEDSKCTSEEAELTEASFKYHMDKAVSAHERGDEKKKQYHLDNAKTARYSLKSTEITKHKDLLDKYKQMTEQTNIEEETELDETIKLNSKVMIHDPGKSHHGKVGYVGEIRHGAYKGAAKTYTIDYDHNEETGRAKSIQLDKKNIKSIKEESAATEKELIEDIAKNPYRKGSVKHEIWKRDRESYLKQYSKDPHGKMKPGDNIGNAKVVKTEETELSESDLPVHVHKSPYEGAEAGEYSTMFPHNDRNAAQSFAKHAISKGGKARIARRGGDYYVYHDKLVSKADWRKEAFMKKEHVEEAKIEEESAATKKVMTKLKNIELMKKVNIPSPQERRAMIAKEKEDEKKKQRVEENFNKDAESYRAHLQSTLPHMVRFLEKTVGGQKPNKEHMLAAIETGYNVMKQTGDKNQAGKAVMDHIHRVSKQGVKEEIELDEAKIDKEHPIVKEYDTLKKNHDLKSLRNLIKTQHRIVDTSGFTTKDHAISHYLRNKHGDKKVDAAFGLKEAENKIVLDRKTGKQYDADEEFEKLMKNKKVVAQMKRMKAENGKGWPKRKEQSVSEALSPKQKKLDVNDNDKIDSDDLKAIRGEKDNDRDENVNTEVGGRKDRTKGIRTLNPSQTTTADYVIDKAGRKHRAHRIVFNSGQEDGKTGVSEQSNLDKERSHMELDEREMTAAEMQKREKYVKGMKKSFKDFTSKYGKRAKSVMYATATKQAMKEETELDIETNIFCEAMISHSDLMDKVAMHKKAGNTVVDYHHTPSKAHITTIDSEGIKRKVTYTNKGTSMENMGPYTGGDEGEGGKKIKKSEVKTVKRGRGRPRKNKFAEAAEVMLSLSDEEFDQLVEAIGEDAFDTIIEALEITE